MATIRFHVVPKAKGDKIVGEHGGAIKIKLRAPAVEGKANAALRRFLAERLQISEHRVALQIGHRSRDKIVRIDGLGENEARQRLLAGSEVRSPIQSD